MDQVSIKATRLEGEVLLPPDKSIAHRLAILGAIADGNSFIRNYPVSADPQSTLSCLRRLGVRITTTTPGEICIHGRGMYGLRRARAPLDCGNSGTTMRLLAGMLAGQFFPTTLIGDASLGLRPMRRIASPLREMGATVSLQDGHAPIDMGASTGLSGITYTLPVPSAQVKSCVLVAGLYAHGETTVVETTRSRDHTERMLGLDVAEAGGRRRICVRAVNRIAPFDTTIPRDFSAAAFFLVAGSIVSGGAISLPGVGLNPTRTALLEVLTEMGAAIEVKNRRTDGVEPLADLVVRPSRLKAISIRGALISNLIDEIPILAVAALCAEGRTEVRDASELRIKECDRIDATVRNLQALGGEVEEFSDGFAVVGRRPLAGTSVDSFDDHRIAMAMGVAGLVSQGTTTVHRASAARISFPGFWQALRGLTPEGDAPGARFRG